MVVAIFMLWSLDVIVDDMIISASSKAHPKHDSFVVTYDKKITIGGRRDIELIITLCVISGLISRDQ